MAATAGTVLLDAILAEPDDDGLRLIYADYLADNGDEARAEFIRLQVEMDQVLGADDFIAAPPAPPDRARRFLELCDRTRDLLADAAAPRWILPKSWPGMRNSHDTLELCYVISPRPNMWFRFRRGFITRMGCPLSWWRKEGSSLLRRHPILRAEATDKRPTVSPVVHGRFQWLRGDNTHDGLPSAIFARLDSFLGYGVVSKEYDSAEDALSALSRAMLSAARQGV